jgi:hypothetical protein
MSMEEANKLISRIRRTTANGKGFNAVMSDLMRITLTGRMSLEEGKAVQRVADEQLRKFDRELREQQVNVRR